MPSAPANQSRGGSGGGRLLRAVTWARNLSVAAMLTTFVFRLKPVGVAGAFLALAVLLAFVEVTVAEANK